MRLALRIYYRRAYVTGLEQIPRNKPIILACNHPNAFLDGILVATLMSRSIHFLVRSDVFSTFISRILLRSMNQIPIYRRQEGVGNLAKNKGTFEECYKLFRKNAAVLIFSEGDSITERKLRPLKKGTARIAFGALQKFHGKLDLYVVPVGINYIRPDKIRQDVIVGFGTPVKVQKWIEAYNEQSPKAINDMSQVLHTSMGEQIAVVDRTEDEALSSRLAALERNEELNSFLPWKRRNRKALEREVHYARYINHLHHISEDFRDRCKEQVDHYYKELAKNGLSDLGLALKHGQLWWRLPLALIQLPILIAGWLVNFFPFLIGSLITTLFVTEPIFKNSVRLCSSFLFYLFYLPSVYLVAKLWYPEYAIWTFLALPVSGYLAMVSWDYLKRAWAVFRWDVFRLIKRKKSLKLLELRQDLASFRDR